MILVDYIATASILIAMIGIFNKITHTGKRTVTV
jgi:hypothetical protein